jgi:hypothetical protein
MGRNTTEQSLGSWQSQAQSWWALTAVCLQRGETCGSRTEQRSTVKFEIQRPSAANTKLTNTEVTYKHVNI